MNDYFLREGFQSYYVVKREKEFSYEERMLKEQACYAILPFVIRRVDDESYYYYQTSGHLSLEQKLKNTKASTSDYRLIYEKILEAVGELEEYLLPAEGILLEGAVVFYDEKKEQIRFCYSPGRKKDLMQQMQHLTEEFLEWINYEDRELVEFLYGIQGEFARGILPEQLYKITKNAEQEETEEKWQEEEEGIFEIEKNAEIMKGSYEGKQSRQWYGEIAASIGISGMLMFFLGYQFVEIFQYGWMWQKLKIFLLVVPALAANFLKKKKKIRQKSTIEEITTILTDEDSIDKIS